MLWSVYLRRYPMTELAVGTLFVITAVVHRYDSLAAIAIDLVFVTMLAAVTLTDLERRVIPNKILIVGSVLCVAIAVPTDPSGMAQRLIAAATAGGLLFLVVLAYPGGMGLGDVKLTFVMVFLGMGSSAFSIALLAGSTFGLAMIARDWGKCPQNGDSIWSLFGARRSNCDGRW